MHKLANDTVSTIRMRLEWVRSIFTAALVSRMPCIAAFFLEVTYCLAVYIVFRVNGRHCIQECKPKKSRQVVFFFRFM